MLGSGGDAAVDVPVEDQAVLVQIAATPPAGTRFVMDLSGLHSADPDAVDALKKLMEQGAVLQGASPYLAQLLVVDGPDPENTGDD